MSLRDLEGGDVVLAHYVGVAAMDSPRGVRVGVNRFRMGEPAAHEALRLQGLGFGILVRLTSAARVARVGGWMGECNSDGRQRDERGNKGWQDDGALHGIPYL